MLKALSLVFVAVLAGCAHNRPRLELEARCYEVDGSPRDLPYDQAMACHQLYITYCGAFPEDCE